MTLTPLQNFIAGKFTDAKSATTMDIVSPATEEVVAVSPISGPEDVDDAFAAAAEAAKSWNATTPEERQAVLLRVADAVEANADKIAAAQHGDTGQITEMVKSEEVLAGASQLRFFAGAARISQGLSAGEYMEGMTSYVRREPIGVVAQVVPWNYPFMMLVWKIGPALAAGNTVVLKPSETTPRSAVAFMEAVQNILPPGVLNIVLGDRTTGELMTNHPTPGLIALTGSVRAGEEIAKAAASRLARVHLELGGKAPVVVFPDADLAEAAEGIAQAGYFNAGQDCTAATRVLVHQDVAEEFTKLLVAQTEVLTTGDSEDPDTFFGPLNNIRHFEKVSELVDNAPEWATVIAGGHRVGDKGYYYAPTVITGLKQDDELIQTEIFGPVITVQEFATEDEAIEMANGVQYALSSSVWTSDHKRANRFSRELDFGCVWINTHIPLVAEMPHGGFKRSGYGKDLSVYGVEDYTRIKHVMSSH